MTMLAVERLKSAGRMIFAKGWSADNQQLNEIPIEGRTRLIGPDWRVPAA
jgi:hypothetical protein